MSVTSENRKAILGNLILKLFPKMMQLILRDYISPRGLRSKFQQKDIRTTLTKSEITLLEKLPKTDKFTVELCYKILRYENLMMEPKCKWGNIPHDTELEIADDIQRIIDTTNDVISKQCDDITEMYYNAIKKKTQNIAKRVDGYLHQDICLKMYRTICSSDLHSAEILQKLTLLQTIDVDQNVDAESEFRENYSRLSLVIIDTFPNILRDVIRSIIPAKTLYQLCVPNHLSSFTSDQQKNLQDLKLTNSYTSLDISIIYRLLRQFELIPPPTLGWGNFPDKNHNKLGDDVERIRYYRNQVAHRNNTNIEKIEFEEYFNHFLNIGNRMDLNLPHGTNYEGNIKLHKTCRMDKQMQIKYENALKELENIKLRFERTPIKFYWGDSFEKSLGQLRSLIQDEKLLGRQKVRVQIIFECESDVEKTVDILNSLREEINTGLSGIEFIVANKGSIVLNVDITLDLIKTNEILLSTMALFLEKILKHTPTCTTERIDMVLVPIEEFTTWNTQITTAEPVYLHFDFEADLFETDENLEEQLCQISDAISKHSNGSAAKSNITATLLPISLENLSTTEEAFAQAQSPVNHNLPASVSLRQQLNVELSQNEYWVMCDCLKIGNLLAFIDESFKKRLIICNVDGTDIRCIPLSYKPWYITEVNSNTIAVSCTHDRIVLIINVPSGSVTGKIINSKCCFGISHDDDKLFVVIRGNLHVMDLTGFIIRIIPLPSETIMDIAVQRERFVCIDETSVYCCWLDGTLMWKFDEKKFKRLSHLTTDKKGNVYVTDSGNNIVVVISDDGRHFREILSESDGLCKPYGIHFDLTEDILTVCNESNRTALLYYVKAQRDINQLIQI